MYTKLPGKTLTVVIRDDAPMIHCGDSPSYRTVRLELTEEQRAALTLRCTSTVGLTDHYEQISQVILEED